MRLSVYSNHSPEGFLVIAMSIAFFIYNYLVCVVCTGMYGHVHVYAGACACACVCVLVGFAICNLRIFHLSTLFAKITILRLVKYLQIPRPKLYMLSN